MVAIVLFERTDGHPQVLRRPRQRHVGLHEPGRAGVALPVRRNVLGKSCIGDDPFVTGADPAFQRPPAVVQDRFDGGQAVLGALGVQCVVLAAPPAQVGEEPFGDAVHRTALVRLVRFAPPAAEDPAPVQIHPGAVV